MLGPVAMYVAKRRGAHTRTGWAYVWMMGLIFASAAVMSIVRPTLFLMGVSVLSFYAALSGQRALARRRGGGMHSSIDVWIAWAALAMCALLIIASAAWLLREPAALLAWLGLAFGAVPALNATSDLRSFRSGQQPRSALLALHIDRILGSFIGLTTALGVQTVGPRLLAAGMPESLIWIVWVVPSLIGIPLATFTIRRTIGKQSQPRPATAS